MATRNKPAAAKASAATDAAANGSGEMVFDGGDFKPIPTGSTHVVFKIVDAGNNQSATIGVAVFEQTDTPNGPWTVVSKQTIDNLPDTPDAASLVFSVKPGARYAITFKGEMHSLSTDNNPLSLTLTVTADGAGKPIEDFGGAKTVDGRFCSVRGRALPEAAA